MDKVTEIRSGIIDIQMSSKFLLKRVNKIKDDGDQECTCHHESKSIETEIRRLQSHMKSLEDKVMTTDESRLNTDLESMMERLGVLESKFQQNETDNTASRSAYTNSYTEPRLNTVSGNESHERRQLSDKSDVTQKKDNTILKDNTENVERLIGTGSESFENRSQVTSKQSTGRKYKSNLKSEIAIRKPNFTKPNKSGSCFVSVGLIKQDVKLCYDGEIYWRSLAQNELDEYRARYMFLEGVHSIICLDISESMANSNAWTEARTFITDYLTGLEKMKSHATDIKTEYVALVTFGHQTKIQVGYTDDFRNIEKELDKTKLGGPTQMYGGVLMALAAAMCSGHRIVRLDNCSHIFTKIILVSDGRPTEDDLIAGPDIVDSSKIDDTKAKIIHEMDEFRRKHYDLFFVPVGNSDEEFHRTMAEFSGGLILDKRRGKRFSKRQYLTSRLLDPIGFVAGLTIRGSDDDISNEDREDLKIIQASAKRHRDDNRNSRNVYNETKSKQLPPIGSRVRRGPDWHYRMQDSNGPGTVIGHADNENQIWVEWDADENQNIYVYGPLGCDVLIVDEPRKLNPGEKIAVGCKVVPGKDWKSTDSSVRIGVVIKVNRSKKKAKVRWNNGKRDSYLYEDLQEIKVKEVGNISSGNFRHMDESPKQGYELEPPKAMTIEEYAAKEDSKKNKNF